MLVLDCRQPLGGNGLAISLLFYTNSSHYTVHCQRSSISGNEDNVQFLHLLYMYMYSRCLLSVSLDYWQLNAHLALLGRNPTLFCCVFRVCYSSSNSVTCLKYTNELMFNFYPGCRLPHMYTYRMAANARFRDLTHKGKTSKLETVDLSAKGHVNRSHRCIRRCM